MVWIQLLAGPILWSIHFLIGYILIEAFCQLGWNFQIIGVNGLSFILGLLTVLAVLGAVLFALKSYRSWKNINTAGSLREQFRDSAHWFDEPSEFVYFSGFLLSVLFTATIVMVGLPALFLHPC